MAADNKAAAEPAKGGGGAVQVLIGVANFAATAALAAFVLMGGKQAAPVVGAEGTSDGGVASVTKSSDDEPGPIVKLDDFVVQLRNPEFDRYMRISFQLVATSANVVADLQRAEPRIRDAFIAYLSDRTFEEMRGSQGLARAKAELLKNAVDAAPKASIKELLITNYVVQ
jgi:flagellar FliL protein